MDDSTPDTPSDALAAAPKRGRTPITGFTPEPLPEIPAEVEAHLEASAHAARTIDAAVESIAAQQFACAQIIGQMQAFAMVGKLATTSHTVLLRQMKESKAYKGMKIPTAGGVVATITTFEQFCEALGTSRRKADEDIQNLNAFGEEFMESAKRMGLGYRDLRKLRTLPEDDRALIIEGEKVGNDPDALKDLLEELAAKRAKDKDALKEARANQDALEKVLAAKNKALDAAQTELAKIKNLPPDERITLRVERENAALKDLHAEGLKLLGSWGAYLARVVAILHLPDDDSGSTARAAVELTSGLCGAIAADLTDQRIDVDFRILVYPPFLDTPLRGDASKMDATI